MADIVAQVAKYLAERTGKGYGSVIFYYQMPDSANECVVVQRNRSNTPVPIQIDAEVHSIRVAARAVTSDAAYQLAEDMWHALLADNEVDEGFIQLDETYAQVVLYDKPQWYTQDQQGRKVFDFTARLITKRL